MSGAEGLKNTLPFLAISMKQHRFATVACVVVLGAVLARLPANAQTIPGQWTLTAQSGIAQGMQLSLGGRYNPGPAIQNRLTIQGKGVFRHDDTVQLTGWNTTDLNNHSTDADTAVRYRTPIGKLAHGTLTGGGGFEYWYYPSVLGGAQDLALDSYLAWTGGEKVPITISGNGKTILRSRLPYGTMGIFQAQHRQRLPSLPGTGMSLLHGPVYVYNWDLYGRPGHRVLRYSTALQVTCRKWIVEAAYRPQAGLQPRIPDNQFWSVSVIRSFRLW